ncbi:MAG: hypothetical protein CMJ27_00045 [Phycisphaerae bacterium]|nr:hypothetical protein [Phycisphaerae bacterium]OUX03494.1 MAG: hypothetical protein CBD91_00045 [Phycisphaeraceae bacterium TMED231]
MSSGRCAAWTEECIESGSDASSANNGIDGFRTSGRPWIRSRGPAILAPTPHHGPQVVRAASIRSR